ncbi:unnamed protein product [Pylaiella littoralis]
MKWAMLTALLVCESTAFFLPAIVRGLSPRSNALVERRDFRHRCCCVAVDNNEEDATDEHNPGTSDIDEAGISDADLEKLIKGLEHGSSRSTPRSGAGRRGDLDEMKMIHLLRKQLGEEDFYKVFDPRNPRIGEL